MAASASAAATAAAAKSRLDMAHGFMKCIIKNQVDRDNYDKEVRAKKNDKPKAATTSSQPQGKSRKPPLQTYVPPASRGDCNKTRLFRLEYEHEDGEVYHLLVHQEDSIPALARKFGAARGMSEVMIRALTELLQQEYNLRHK